MFDIAGKGRQHPIGVAARRFDFDHIGAEIGELPRRIRRGNIAKLDDSKMTERGFVTDCFCQEITFRFRLEKVFSPRSHEEHEVQK